MINLLDGTGCGSELHSLIQIHIFRQLNSRPHFSKNNEITRNLNYIDTVFNLEEEVLLWCNEVLYRYLKYAPTNKINVEYSKP